MALPKSLTLRGIGRKKERLSSDGLTATSLDFEILGLGSSLGDDLVFNGLALIEG